MARLQIIQGSGDFGKCLLNYTVLVRVNDSWGWLEYRPGRRFLPDEAIRTAADINNNPYIEAIAVPNGPA